VVQLVVELVDNAELVHKAREPLLEPVSQDKGDDIAHEPGGKDEMYLVQRIHGDGQIKKVEKHGGEEKDRGLLMLAGKYDIYDIKIEQEVHQINYQDAVIGEYHKRKK
jgi:hypothetical protein